MGIGLHTDERTTMRSAVPGHGVVVIRKDHAIDQQAFAMRCRMTAFG
jgi:hypothetical protein